MLIFSLFSRFKSQQTHSVATRSQRDFVMTSEAQSACTQPPSFRASSQYSLAHMFFVQKTYAAGFTLVELMVSVSILLIIIATVMIQFRAFDSSVLLKTLSYDVAFSVWEARSYALGVRRGVTDFSESYGVSFTPGETGFELFTYINDNDPTAIPKNEGNGVGGVTVSVVETYKLGRSFEVKRVCVVESPSTEDCTIDRLDISFKRPEHAARFYADGYGDSGSISATRIYLGTEDGAEEGVVTVGYAGQIDVDLEQN